ncbi:MAG: hypothetical protein ABIC82_06830 [bacterium]
MQEGRFIVKKFIVSFVVVVALFFATISFAATYRQTGHYFWWSGGSGGGYHPIVYFQAYGARTDSQHVLIGSGDKCAIEKNWIVWDFGNGLYGVLVETRWAMFRIFSWWKDVHLVDG